VMAYVSAAISIVLTMIVIGWMARNKNKPVPA